MERNLPVCPVETTLQLIGDRWKVLIIRDLPDGPKRFGEWKKSVGAITQKVLTTQLRAMEANGLLTRTAYAEVPPRVEYARRIRDAACAPYSKPWAWGQDYKAQFGRALS